MRAGQTHVMSICLAASSSHLRCSFNAIVPWRCLQSPAIGCFERFARRIAGWPFQLLSVLSLCLMVHINLLTTHCFVFYPSYAKSSHLMTMRYRSAFFASILIIVVITVLRIQRSWPRDPDKIKNDKKQASYKTNLNDTSFCASRFGLPYLQNLSSSATNYCTPDSSSDLTCFRTAIDAKGRVDSFCAGGPAVFDPAKRQFALHCRVRGEAELEGAPLLERFPVYWYQTGPEYVLREYVKFSALDVQQEQTQTQKQKQKRKYAILVKREASNYNLWHSLLEIFSVQMSMDVLRMFPGEEEQEKGDINAQVIILDELHDGPVFDLWSLHPSSTKPIRLNEMTEPTETMNIVLPLPGGSNPFWQGDWEDLPCQRSELLRVFVERVLAFYRLDINEIESENADSGSRRKTVVTFIDRREKRRLINQEQHLASLRDALFNTTTTTTTTANNNTTTPAAELKVVDFAALSFAEQLRVVRETDVLVGVHGAGLTHGMFLRPGSAMVEILPGGLEHRGFRNLARQMGHGYFCVLAEAQRDWQQSDVGVGEEFAEVVLDAVHAINGINE